MATPGEAEDTIEEEMEDQEAVRPDSATVAEVEEATDTVAGTAAEANKDKGTNQVPENAASMEDIHGRTAASIPTTRELEQTPSASRLQRPS